MRIANVVEDRVESTHIIGNATQVRKLYVQARIVRVQVWHSYATGRIVGYAVYEHQLFPRCFPVPISLPLIRSLRANQNCQRVEHLDLAVHLIHKLLISQSRDVSAKD